ncbi:unnamed protein product [Amoebophrya sp. A120]|nr:unnamed protein product [Amoebophrya sp. A120]|eukprot:GSA120T00002952001.1
MTTLTATVTRDLAMYQTRDLAPQVHMILSILPQCSEDMACEALIQSGEDVERAMELLLSKIAERDSPKARAQKAASFHEDFTSDDQAFQTQGANGHAKTAVPSAATAGGYGDNYGGKQTMQQTYFSGSSAAQKTTAPAAVYEQQQQQQMKQPVEQQQVVTSEPVAPAAAAVAPQPVPEPVAPAVVEEVYDPQPVVPEFAYFLQQVQLDRAPSRAEKDLLKFKKKMREIETIEKKLETGEKVDQLQLPKLDKKGELMFELKKTEEIVNKCLRQDAEALREKHIEQEWARIEAEKAEKKRQEEERREQERIRLEEERLRAEEEARRKAEEEEARRKAEAEAAERRRIQEEEMRRQREEEERRRKQQQEEQAERLRQSSAKGNWAGVATAGAWNGQQQYQQQNNYSNNMSGKKYSGYGKGQQQPPQNQQPSSDYNSTSAQGGQYNNREQPQQPSSYGQYNQQQPAQQWNNEAGYNKYNANGQQAVQQPAAAHEEEKGEEQPSDDWGLSVNETVLSQQKSVFAQQQTSNQMGRSNMMDQGNGGGKGWNNNGKSASMQDGNWRQPGNSFAPNGGNGKKGKGKGKGKNKSGNNGYNNRGPGQNMGGF